MSLLRGYQIDDNWNIVGNGQWLFGKHGGQEYFIKKFDKPKYPNERMVSPAVAKRMKGVCKEWEKEQLEMINALKEYATPSGNLVVPIELFKEGTTYYKVTYKVDTASLDIKAISKLEDNKKLLLLRTLAHSVKSLHRARIVHGDLKPENILVTRGATGNYVTKVIDFDDSYFEGRPPTAEETVGTINYYSPELADYILNESIELGKKITCKSDIFALGLIFHEYWTGSFPVYEGHMYAGIHVLEGGVLGVSKMIPPNLRKLISDMLDANPSSRPSINEVFTRLTLDPPKELPKSDSSVSPEPSGIHSKSISSGESVSSPVSGDYVINHGNGQYTLHYNGKKRVVPDIFFRDFIKKHPDIRIINK